MTVIESMHIRKIKSENLLSGKGQALDLGCGVGSDAISLAAMGYSVDAVDQNQASTDALVLKAKENNFSINIYHKDIKDFNIQAGKYSIIICNNVLPFVEDKQAILELLKNIANGLGSKGVLYFTAFGPRDEWADNPKMSFFDYDELVKFLGTLSIEIYHRSTEEGYGKKMDGSIKYWHIHRFFCIKK